MRKLFILAFIIFQFQCWPNGKVTVKESSVESFADLAEVVKNFGADEMKRTLVVMDDDDTLTMMECTNPDRTSSCQYLGGPAWYSWQSNLITEYEKSADKKIPLLPYQVAVNQTDLLKISSLLLSINEMVYTENNIPEILLSLSQAGVKLVVLTARGSSNISATEAQFSARKVAGGEYTDFLDLISKNSLKGNKSGMTSIASPFIPKHCNMNPDLPNARLASYRQGVMYVAGQNKGAMLQCLLSLTDSSKIRNIVFIDDTKQNVNDVYNAFSKSQNYNVTALHYTKLQKHKLALTEGGRAKEYQKAANTRWVSIKNNLNQQLILPAIPK